MELIELRRFNQNHSLFAVWEGDEHLATLELVLNDDRAPVAIMGLYVDEEKRGHGWGRKIVEELPANVRIMNVEKSAKGFWKKMGRT